MKHLFQTRTGDFQLLFEQGRILGIRCVSQASERRRYGPTDGPTDGRTDPLIEVLRSTYSKERENKKISENRMQKSKARRSKKMGRKGGKKK